MLKVQPEKYLAYPKEFKKSKDSLWSPCKDLTQISEIPMILSWLTIPSPSTAALQK